ncbi:Uncharacterized protein APZ42_032585 [Daphnia magna]|uniref:Uncharacterized protein n=1 Tax=Daphnia magna TaxID=35525 RepID=A0A164LP05_9CRUS|nr:Uncharacterized protein APZ42_032585 [Daphnia magna]
MKMGKIRGQSYDTLCVRAQSFSCVCTTAPSPGRVITFFLSSFVKRTKWPTI